MNEYDIGDVATLVGTFTVAGVATDPTTITLIVRTPAGVETTYTYALTELTKVSPGVFTRDQECTEAGVWAYRFVGTGDVKSAGERQFRVNRSLFASP